MSDLNLYYLQQMGIDVWLEREKKTNLPELNQLERLVSSCQRCSLAESRTQTVFARGNPRAKIMIIGEAPGFYEDQKGEPFVGKAGLLLDKMLSSIQLNSQDVYIANVIKCRPPENRDPKIEEINQCSNYLKKQIELIQPKLILAVGRFSGQFVTKKSLPMNQLRKEIHYYESIPCIVSYHPAYLLRNPKDKKKAYEDLAQVRQYLFSLSTHG